MSSIDLNAGPDEDRPKIRRLNRLPIFIFIGLAVVFFGVIIWGLSQRGLMRGGEQPDQTQGQPASDFADEMKRGIGDGMIGEPRPDPVIIQPSTETAVEEDRPAVNPFQPTTRQETVQQTTLEPEADWRERLLREQEEALLRERHRQLQDAHATLARAYEAWRRDYVLVSPIPGRVAFHRIWNVNQWVAADEEVMTVIPSLDGIVGRVELGQHSSGKVEVGQRVVIKLDGYPYREFGVVEGRVDSVPSIAREGVYLVTVRLPEGLRTSHGHELTLRHDMRGTAEIVTADLRLLERMFFQLSSLMEGR